MRTTYFIRANDQTEARIAPLLAYCGSSRYVQSVDAEYCRFTLPNAERQQVFQGFLLRLHIDHEEIAAMYFAPHLANLEMVTPAEIAFGTLTIVTPEEMANQVTQQEFTQTQETIDAAPRQPRIIPGRREYPGLSDRRRRQAAQQAAEENLRRQAEAQFRIQWDNTEVWRTPTTTVPIRRIADQALWSSVNWMVRNQVQLCENSGEANAISPGDTPGLGAGKWLKKQPLFRAMLQEALRRDLTFPPDVFAYLKNFMLHNGQYALEGYVPWRDPASAAETNELKPFIDDPLIPPEFEADKEFRAIVL